MNIRTKLIGTVVVGAALLVPVAQDYPPADLPVVLGEQAQRPDDQAGPRSPDAIAAQDTFANGVPGGGYTAPEETFASGVPGGGYASPEVSGAVVRGDYKDGVGTSPGSVVIVGDDKRGLTQHQYAYWPIVDPANYAQYNEFAYRRALPQDLEREPIQVVSPSAGFDWNDALIGGLGGAGAALLLAGCAFLYTSKRTRARTA